MITLTYGIRSGRAGYHTRMAGKPANSAFGKLPNGQFLVAFAQVFCTLTPVC
jgi:hypothetical protein